MYSLKSGAYAVCGSNPPFCAVYDKRLEQLPDRKSAGLSLDGNSLSGSSPFITTYNNTEYQMALRIVIGTPSGARKDC